MLWLVKWKKTTIGWKGIYFRVKQWKLWISNGIILKCFIRLEVCLSLDSIRSDEKQLAFAKNMLVVLRISIRTCIEDEHPSDVVDFDWIIKFVYFSDWNFTHFVFCILFFFPPKLILAEVDSNRLFYFSFVHRLGSTKLAHLLWLYYYFDVFRSNLFVQYLFWIFSGFPKAQRLNTKVYKLKKKTTTNKCCKLSKLKRIDTRNSSSLFVSLIGL